MKYKKYIIIFLIAFIFIYINNNLLTTNSITIESNKIPEEFNNYKILQLSDLHNKSFGKNQKWLIKEIEKTNSDIIVITGDIVSSGSNDKRIALDLLSYLTANYPVYYVPGNHEAYRDDYSSLMKEIELTGVTMMYNSSTLIKKGDSTLNLFGVNYNFFSGYIPTKDDFITTKNNKEYNILLSHEPQYFDYYHKYDFDLTFSGHAHGGQFRIPFFKQGIIAPDQGLFPKLTEGVHKKDNSTLIISRGLGNSVIPIRLFNTPEIITVTLKAKA